MSDAAFQTAPYAAYTTAELQAICDVGSGNEKMTAEITRRAAVEAGDVSQMTPGERLRFNRTGKARG